MKTISCTGLVLEHCAGGPLSRVITHTRLGSQLGASVLMDWAIQIAEGMRYLHEGVPICVVHRDLKSGNGELIF